MRLSIYLEINKPIIPADYRRIFMSYIKHCIESTNRDLFSMLYDTPNVLKPFTFSVYFPDIEESKRNDSNSEKLKELNCGQKAIINFSTNDNEILISLYNYKGNVRNKKYTYNKDNLQLELTCKRMVLQPYRKIKENKLTFKTLSPVLINESSEKRLTYLYYPDNKEEFKASLKFNLEEIRKKFLPDVNDEIKFEINTCKKMVVNHYNQYMTANNFVIEISSSPKILQLFYDVGIGVRRSQGFGMLEIVKSNSLL